MITLIKLKIHIRLAIMKYKLRNIIKFQWKSRGKANIKMLTVGNPAKKDIYFNPAVNITQQ